MLENILVSVDGSGFAEQIIPYAAEHAARSGRRLTLLRVFRPSSLPQREAPKRSGGLPAEDPQASQPPVTRLPEEDEAQAYLERLAAPLRERGLEVEIAVVQAGREKTGEAIVRYAETPDTGLVAIATHGEGGLKRLAFGSVADYVLRNLGRPVLLVRPEESRA